MFHGLNIYLKKINKIKVPWRFVIGLINRWKKKTSMAIIIAK